MDVIRAYRCHPFHGQRVSQTMLADWLHMSQAAVCRMEKGRQRVTIDEIAQIARALGVSVALHWTPSQLEARDNVDPISRRSLFGAGVGAAFGASFGTTAPAAAREIDPELVFHWMKLLHVLDRHDAMFGPHDALGAVRHELGLIARHRQIARGDLRTQLLRVESRWAGFASWLAQDADDPHIGDYWADRALRLAEEAGYRDMVAWVLMRRSRSAVEKRDAQAAIGFADAARHTSGASKEIRALCALREAQGHALAQDDPACERSLAAASELLDDADNDADAASEGNLVGQYVIYPYVLADQARCWLWLRPRKAISMLEDTLRVWPHDRVRDRGVQQARLALACAAAHEFDRAAVEGSEALAIARATKSHMTLCELKRLDYRLAACDLPEAADFREAFAAFA